MFLVCNHAILRKLNVETDLFNQNDLSKFQGSQSLVHDGLGTVPFNNWIALTGALPLHPWITKVCKITSEIYPNLFYNECIY